MRLQQRSAHIALGLALAILVVLGMVATSWALWTPKAPLPVGRWFLSCCALDGKIYAMGGTGVGITGTEVEVYDPATDEWTAAAPMLEPRGAFCTSVVNGRIYAMGGQYPPEYGGAIRPTVEEYDPATDTWTAKTEMPAPRHCLSTSVVDGKIYAIGGSQSTSLHGSTRVDEYDPATDTWATKAPLPYPRAGHSSSVVEGKIHVMSGMGTSYEVPPDSRRFVYDPATDTWTSAEDVPTPRMFFASCELEGKIYTIGGSKYNWPFAGCSTMEAYEPATGIWTSKSELPSRRYGLGAAVLGGKIYAIGGRSTQASLTAVEVYDPAVEERLSEGLISATETFGATWAGQATPLEVTVELEAPLETTESLRKMILDLSLLGIIPSDLPLVHVGDGRYTLSTTVTPLRNGHYDLPILVETPEGERYRFLTVSLDVYPGGDEYLYQDQMGPRWEVEVSAGELDLTGSDVVHGGSYAQAITLQTAGKIKYTFEDPDGFSTFGYTTLEFWIHPGTASTEKATLGLMTTEGAKKYPRLKDDLGITLEPDVWQVVSIPLEDLGLVDTRLKEIQLPGVVGTFYLDDLAFIVAEYRLEEAAAIPERIKADGTMQTLLTVQTVSAVSQPGAPPTVTIDLTPIGGEQDAVMTDDGTGGDKVAADGIYSLQATVDTEIQNGLKELIITSTDRRLRLVRTPLSVGVVPVEDAVLYRDEVEAGWTLRLYRTEMDPTSTEYVHDGSYACAVTFQTSAQMDYIVDDPDGLRTFGYATLEFWINPGSASVEELKIVAMGRGVSEVLPLVEQMGLSFEPERWQLVSIPVEALGLSDTHLEWIRFTGDVQGTFYIDDMRLVAEEIEIPTAVEEVSEATALPLGYSLSQNVPNPFNPLTTIAYDLPEASEVTLTIYTITGQKVAMLVDAHQEAGRHRILFDGSGFGTGVYLYRLEAGEFVEARRMVLLK